METLTLIPTPDAIPVPPGWFRFFLILTFMAHILFMNVMVGCGIIAFFSHLKKDNGTRDPAPEKDMAGKLTFIIAFTINLGVAPLLFLQVLYGHFVYVSSQLMAVWWLSVIGLLIIAYYSAYYYKFNFDRLNHRRKYFMGLTVAIFLVIGFFFTHNMTLMLNPEAWSAYFENPEGTFLNLSDPTLFPRFLHFMTASVAIGGLFTAIVWRFKRKKGVPGAQEHIDRGMKWFVYSTLVQIPLGLWFLVSLPREIMLLFMGRDIFHTTILLTSLGLLALTILSGVYRKVRAAAGSVLALIFTMVLMRDMVRTAYLGPFFRVSELQVVPEYSPLICFLIALVIGAGLVIYVIRLGIRAGEA